MTFLKHLCFYLALSITAPALSQVIPVEPLTKGFFATQTMTMLHERRDAELIVIVIMGYPGHFDLKIEDSYVKNQTARMMRDLPSYRSKAKINVVIFDSPSLLQGISARSNNDHLNRIESVVKFYKEKFNLPIWLFGHSDGSISVSEFLNRSIDSRKSVAGAILSAGRDETRISEDWKTPTLVLHHEKDACEVTTFYGAKRYFNRIKQTNTGPTEFATVIGGISSGAPCSTGYHMYQGAFEETLSLIEDFIGRHK